MALSFKSFSFKLLRIALLVCFFMIMAGIGTYVTLTLIIKTEDTVIVPDLVGKDVLVGLEMLSDLGLNTRVKKIDYDDQVPQHHVIEQDPEPGSTIKRGRDVKIRVSRGPESIVMPNLSALSLQQSRILLTENGLCQGIISRMTSTVNPFGQVMAHHPSPGVVVPRGACVDLLVSQGASPPAMMMTDLKGFTLETAILRLKQWQLDVGRIRSVHLNDAPMETVVDQTPLTGYRVSLGSRVDLTVNRAPPGTPTEGMNHSHQAELFRFTLENGFLNKRVQVKLNHPQTSFSLFDDFMAPGQEIWLLIPKNGNPTVLVYVDGQLADSRMMDGR